MLCEESNSDMIDLIELSSSEALLRPTRGSHLIVIRIRLDPSQEEEKVV